MKHNESHMLLIDEGKAKRQPIVEFDINKAIFNILTMPETIGETYELGGPQVYTHKELFEFIGNNLGLRMTYSNFTYEEFMRLYYSPNINWEKAAHWAIVRPDYLASCRVDNIIKKREGVKTIEDLHILPLATHHYIADVANWFTDKKASENESVRSLEEQNADDDGH